MGQSRLSIIPSTAVEDNDLTPTQFRILCAIGSYTGKDLTAYPKQQTVADMIGVERETVNRACKVLERKGYIKVQHQRKKDGRMRSNLYTVLLDQSDPRITQQSDARITPPSDRRITPERYHTKDKHALERARGIFSGMIRAGAPVPSVEALSRAVVDFDGCSMVVRGQFDYDRAVQDLEQYLKQAAIQLTIMERT